MIEHHTCLRHRVILFTYLAFQGWVTCRENLQIYLKPADPLLIPQKLQKLDLVDRVLLQFMLSEPLASVVYVGCLLWLQILILDFLLTLGHIARATDALRLLFGQQSPASLALVEVNLA